MSSNVSEPQKHPQGSWGVPLPICKYQLCKFPPACALSSGPTWSLGPDSSACNKNKATAHRALQAGDTGFRGEGRGGGTQGLFSEHPGPAGHTAGTGTGWGQGQGSCSRSPDGPQGSGPGRACPPPPRGAHGDACQPPPGPLAPALPGQPQHLRSHPLSPLFLLANFQLLMLPLLCPWARMPALLSKRLRPPPPQAGTGEGAPGQTVSERKRTNRKAACLLLPRSFPRAPEMHSP